MGLKIRRRKNKKQVSATITHRSIELAVLDYLSSGGIITKLEPQREVCSFFDPEAMRETDEFLLEA